jgi:hypothetical protein
MENKDTFAIIKIGITNIFINSLLSEIIKITMPEIIIKLSKRHSIYVYQITFVIMAHHGMLSNDVSI